MNQLPSSNGSAFQKKEERYGPPLEYIGEKLRSAVEAAHDNLYNIRNYVPDNLKREPEFTEQAPENIKKDILLSSASITLHYTLVSYLALYNMLGAANAKTFDEGVANKSKDELKKWLDLIEREGSVNGYQGHETKGGL